MRLFKCLVSYSRTKTANCYPSPPTGEGSVLDWVDGPIQPCEAGMASN